MKVLLFTDISDRITLEFARFLKRNGVPYHTVANRMPLEKGSKRDLKFLSIRGLHVLVVTDYMHSKKAGQTARLINRNDPLKWRTSAKLIRVVEKYNIDHDPDLKVVEVPDDARWYITQQDFGHEYVCEEHRTWS